MTGHFFTGEGSPHHSSLSYHPGKKGSQPLPAMALMEKKPLASGEQGSWDHGVSQDGRCWVCTQARTENEELCLAGPEDECLLCHPSNRLRGSSAHLCPQVYTKVLHALSPGQPGTIQVSPSPSGLQDPDHHNQPQSRRIIAKDHEDIPSDPLSNG